MQQTRRNMPPIQPGQGQQAAAAHQQIAAGKPIPAAAVPCPPHKGKRRRAGQKVGQRPGGGQQQLLRRRHKQPAQPQADAERRDLQFRPVMPQKPVHQRMAALMQERTAQPDPQDAAAVQRQQHRQTKQHRQRPAPAQPAGPTRHAAALPPGHTAAPCAEFQNAGGGPWRCPSAPPCPASARR